MVEIVEGNQVLRFNPFNKNWGQDIPIAEKMNKAAGPAFRGAGAPSTTQSFTLRFRRSSAEDQSDAILMRGRPAYRLRIVFPSRTDPNGVTYGYRMSREDRGRVTARRFPASARIGGPRSRPAPARSRPDPLLRFAPARGRGGPAPILPRSTRSTGDPRGGRAGLEALL